MSALLVPALAAYGLLVVAGALKAARPAATAQALRTQGLPSATGLVRLLGAVEVAAGLAALAGLRAGALAVAALYAGATAFVAVVLLRGRPLSSCGCFGEPDLPPSAVHPAVTALLAVSALVAGQGLPALGGGVLEVVTAVAAAALTAWLAFLVLTGLPRLSAAVHLVGRTAS